MNPRNSQLLKYLAGLIFILWVIKRLTPNDIPIEPPPTCCEGQPPITTGTVPSIDPPPPSSPPPSSPPPSSPPTKTCSEKSSDFEECSKNLTWKVESEADIDKLAAELQQCYQNSGGLCDDDQRQFNNLIHQIKNQKSRIQGHRQKMIRDCEKAAFNAKVICRNVALHTGGDDTECDLKYDASMAKCSARTAYCFFQVNKFTLVQVLCQ